MTYHILDHSGRNNEWLEQYLLSGQILAEIRAIGLAVFCVTLSSLE